MSTRPINYLVGYSCIAATRVRRFFLAVIVTSTLTSCASMVTGFVANDFADSLSKAIQNQDDPETVKTGAPAYLLLIDSMIESNPDDGEVLMTGARLYGSYASVFVDEPKRAKRMADKSWRLARDGYCYLDKVACNIEKKNFKEFGLFLDRLGKGSVDVLYRYALTWAGWIEQNADNWNAVADIPKVQAAMERVVQLDSAHDRGGAHLYLGIMSSLIPRSLGGKPEQVRAHLDKAIEVSKGGNLFAQVAMAERYARMVFDRALHDKILKEVLAADPHKEGFTLTNVLAQRRAETLLKTADRFF